MKNLRITGVLLLFLTAGALWAAATSIKGTVSYTATGSTGSWIAVNSGLEGKIEISPASGTVCIPMNQWDSKNTRRDKHTSDMFETDKFPKACFTLKSIESGALKGDMEIHGIKKPVIIEGSLKNESGKISFTGKMKILVDDYGMTRPVLMGMKVNNEVFVEIKAGGSL
jgi:polyisoprenoid-binding protein YceI